MQDGRLQARMPHGESMSRYAPPVQVTSHDPHTCTEGHYNCEFVKSWWQINRALKAGQRVEAWNRQVEIYD
jgi:hypothetical protein